MIVLFDRCETSPDDKKEKKGMRSRRRGQEVKRERERSRERVQERESSRRKEKKGMRSRGGGELFEGVLKMFPLCLIVGVLMKHLARSFGLV